MSSVMICDDLPSYRALVRAVLEPLGARFVDDAGDGEECIEKFDGEPPAYLLLDVHMPRMNGLEALPRLRAAAPDTKIVVLTSGPIDGLREEALRLGADALIAKPLNILDLPDSICEALAA
jgi:CheY-like chemotaxis protein